jgi:hypothetical protein
MIGYYTVVYRVDGDTAKHDEWWQGIRPLLMTDSEPVSVIVISKGDETRRLDLIREAVNGLPSGYRRYDSIGDMIDAVREALAQEPE